MKNNYRVSIIINRIFDCNTPVMILDIKVLRIYHTSGPPGCSEGTETPQFERTSFAFRLIPLSCLHSKHEATVQPLVSFDYIKDWKQREAASLTLSKGNQICLPAPRKLTNKYVLLQFHGQLCA